jgi:hypothetical protein
LGQGQRKSERRADEIGPSYRHGHGRPRKLAHRLYTEEGLTQKRRGRGPRRRKSAVMRALRSQASAPNERWAQALNIQVLKDVLGKEW